jgi:DNA-binding NtrC family response regulator
VRVTRVTNVSERQSGRASCRLRSLGAGAVVDVSIPPIGVVVGADAAADVRLEDPAVSRRHFTIVPREGGFEVTDLGSKNGTFLDGVAITRAIVPSGAVLRVGSTLLQVLPEESRETISPSGSRSFGRMLGESAAMRQVYAVLERASASPAPILFIGESGTGKELAARAVHESSPRRRGPLVTFDCGASSETLIESDLFGHTKGAFTGATEQRVGAFARAHGGTLFLDEIGDLPLALQPKLLRLLEAGEITPLGAQKSEKHDVRVVAATHHDLWSEVQSGSFRGDLYYRLAVVEVHLPPLRQRREDLPLLVRSFLRDLSAKESGIEGANLDRLLAHSWPGNVRELRNVISRAVALAPPGASFSEMPLLWRAAEKEKEQKGEASVRADRPFQDAKTAVVDAFERAYLEDLMARHGDNLAEAARVAGVERKYLYRMLERVGLARPGKG